MKATFQVAFFLCTPGQVFVLLLRFETGTAENGIALDADNHYNFWWDTQMLLRGGYEHL
jgi:hypothetical protein